METNHTNRPHFLVLVIFFVMLSLAHLDKAVFISNLGIVSLGIFILINQKWIDTWKAWGIISSLYIINVAVHYENTANHAYLSVYIAIAAFLSLLIKDVSFSTNCRLLLGVVMLFASIQKFFCPYYTSGTLIVDYIMRGDSLKWMLSWANDSFAPLQQASLNNILHIRSQFSDNVWLPTLANSTIIDLAKIFAWSGVILEGLAAIVCFNKKLFNTFLSPVMAVSLLIGIYILRNETEFLSLICVLFYYATPDQKIISKRIYISFFIYFVTVSLIEFRPLFLQ